MVNSPGPVPSSETSTDCHFRLATTDNRIRKITHSEEFVRNSNTHILVHSLEEMFEDTMLSRRSPLQLFDVLEDRREFNVEVDTREVRFDYNRCGADADQRIGESGGPSTKRVEVEVLPTDLPNELEIDRVGVDVPFVFFIGIVRIVGSIVVVGSRLIRSGRVTA